MFGSFGKTKKRRTKGKSRRNKFNKKNTKRFYKMKGG
jgi:hypothetical protein